MTEPPDDAEAWTEEQWIEYLDATEADIPADTRAFAPRLDSAAGVVLGAAMVGMHNAMFGESSKPNVVIEAEASGNDDGLKIDLDPDDPAGSTVVVPS